MKRFKKIETRFFVITIGLVLIFMSCSQKDEFISIISNDKTKPDAIKDYKIINFNGGAYITYKLPKVDNILYVKADYDLDGGTKRPAQTKASYFTDTITVNGFSQIKEYNVKLTVVSRANVESDPLTVIVKPDTPVYKLVAKTIQMSPDFQGVRIEAKNVNSESIGIVFLDKALGYFSIRQQSFSSFKDISYAVRGYDTIPQPFAAYTIDKWGNKSDTVYNTIKPLFEQTLNKSLFSQYSLPSETPPYSTAYPLKNMWDGNYTNLWASIQNSPTITMPIYGTINLGTYVKLSRVKYTPRNPAWEYRHGNPRIFSLWGSSSAAPTDFVVPLYADEGTVIGDWVNLKNLVYPSPPSGAAPTAPTQADKDFFNAGLEFEIPFKAPKVRFVRFVVSETWTPGTFTQGAEFDFFGDAR